MKKLFLLFCAFVLSIATWAAEEYDLWIAGTRVTSDNCENLRNLPGVSGQISYSPNSKFLVISYASILNENYGSWSNPQVTAGIYSQIEGLQIAVYGSCNVKSTYGFGLFLSNGCSFALPDVIVDNKTPSFFNVEGFGGMYLSDNTATTYTINIPYIRFVCEGKSNAGLTGKTTGTQHKSSLVVAAEGTYVGFKGRTQSVQNIERITLNDGISLLSPDDVRFEDFAVRDSEGTIVGKEWVKFGNGVGITPANFPDENFRNYLSSRSYATNGVILNTNMSDVMDLYVSNLHIKTLQGIEYFPELRTLHCEGNELTTIDFSQNPKLKVAYCHSNRLHGEGLDNLIASIPYPRGNSMSITLKSSNDFNWCTTSQVQAFVAKSVYPYRTNPQNEGGYYAGENTAYEAYGVWVAGVEIDIANKTRLQRLEDVSGNISYNSTTNTLVLNNATIGNHNERRAANVAESCGIYSESGSLTISLTGECVVSSDNNYAINLAGTSTISGTGKLTASGVGGMWLGSGTTTIAGGVRVDCEGNAGAGICGLSRPGGASYSSTLVVSGTDTELRAKGVSGSIFDLNALTLGDGLYLLTPSSTSFSNHAVRDAAGTVVKGEWVTIQGALAIDETHFPDENFRNVLLMRSEGTDGYLTSEELSQIRTFNVPMRNISDLTGIEYFPELENLYCNLNQLSTIDLSNNRKLKNIDCSCNQIRGTGMREMILNLPQVVSGVIYLSIPDDASEHNLFTRPYVLIAKKLGWDAKYWNGNEYVDYNGWSGLKGDLNYDNQIDSDDVEILVDKVLNK